MSTSPKPRPSLLHLQDLTSPLMELADEREVHDLENIKRKSLLRLSQWQEYHDGGLSASLRPSHTRNSRGLIYCYRHSALRAVRTYISMNMWL